MSSHQRCLVGCGLPPLLREESAMAPKLNWRTLETQEATKQSWPEYYCHIHRISSLAWWLKVVMVSTVRVCSMSQGRAVTHSVLPLNDANLLLCISRHIFIECQKSIKVSLCEAEFIKERTRENGGSKHQNKLRKYSCLLQWYVVTKLSIGRINTSR